MTKNLFVMPRLAELRSKLQVYYYKTHKHMCFATHVTEGSAKQEELCMYMKFQSRCVEETCVALQTPSPKRFTEEVLVLLYKSSSRC